MPLECQSLMHWLTQCTVASVLLQCIPHDMGTLHIYDMITCSLKYTYIVMLFDVDAFYHSYRRLLFSETFHISSGIKTFNSAWLYDIYVSAVRDGACDYWDCVVMLNVQTNIPVAYMQSVSQGLTVHGRCLTYQYMLQQ